MTGIATHYTHVLVQGQTVWVEGTRRHSTELTNDHTPGSLDDWIRQVTTAVFLQTKKITLYKATFPGARIV